MTYQQITDPKDVREGDEIQVGTTWLPIRVSGGLLVVVCPWVGTHVRGFLELGCPVRRKKEPMVWEGRINEHIALFLPTVFNPDMYVRITEVLDEEATG